MLNDGTEWVIQNYLFHCTTKAGVPYTTNDITQCAIIVSREDLSHSIHTTIAPTLAPTQTIVQSYTNYLNTADPNAVINVNKLLIKAANANAQGNLIQLPQLPPQLPPIPLITTYIIEAGVVMFIALLLFCFFMEYCNTGGYSYKPTYTNDLKDDGHGIMEFKTTEKRIFDDTEYEKMYDRAKVEKNSFERERIERRGVEIIEKLNYDRMYENINKMYDRVEVVKKEFNMKYAEGTDENGFYTDKELMNLYFEGNIKPNPTMNEFFNPPVQHTTELQRLIGVIKEFEPTRNDWGNENNYHLELMGYLKHDFSVKYEVQKKSSRPDIIVNGIAIEIKGPTDNRQLRTIADKILRYSNHWNKIVLVLFERTYTREYYNDWIRGMKKYHPNVIIIEK